MSPHQQHDRTIELGDPQRDARGRLVPGWQEHAHAHMHTYPLRRQPAEYSTQTYCLGLTAACNQPIENNSGDRPAALHKNSGATDVGEVVNLPAPMPMLSMRGNPPAIPFIEDCNTKNDCFQHY